MGTKMKSTKDFQAAVIPRVVKPCYPQFAEQALTIQQSYSENLVFDVKLGGKFSNGTAIAIDSKNDVNWLLKPDVTKPSVAKGVQEQPATKSTREACFAYVGKKYVSDQVYPEVVCLTLDGHPAAAIKLDDPGLRNIAFLEKAPQGRQAIEDIFKEHAKTGELWRWLFLDFILANTDRHSGNVLIDPATGLVRLIDHGAAFATKLFDPGSYGTFVPYYVRAGVTDFTHKDPKSKYNSMLKPLAGQEQQLVDWIASLADSGMFHAIESFGIDTSVIKERFEQLQGSDTPIDLLLNIWAGLIHPAGMDVAYEQEISLEDK